MTTAIHFSKALTQRTKARRMMKPRWLTKREKPNSKIEKLRIRLITKMQAKNFDLEILSLHSNWGHGAAELALGNSLRADPCPTLI